MTEPAMDARPTALAVDDKPENLRLLGELLRGEFRVKVAVNGERAIEIARSDDPPDVILLDVSMPGMDGYETCRRLKADPSAGDIPVIFVSAGGGPEDETRGLECGAADFVAKPFNPLVVLARTRTHAELRRCRDALAGKRPR